MPQNQKSIITQATLDCSQFREDIEKISIPPIHAGSTPFSILKYCKKHKQLPFGSTSNRIIEQIESQKRSDISGYYPVYHQSLNNQNKDKENIRIVPFMSGEGRFEQKRNRQPGPGQYNIDNSFKLINKNSPTIPISSIGRSTSQITSMIGPGSYSDNYSEERQKIKQKIKALFEKRKEKYHQQVRNNHKLILKKDANYGQKNSQSLQKYQSDTKINLHSNHSISQTASKPLDRFILRDRTKKYLPEIPIYNQNSLFEVYSPSSSISCNFTSSFIENKNNPYSEIAKVKQITPGPCDYSHQPNNTKLQKQSFVFKSALKRTLWNNQSQNINAHKSKKIKLNAIWSHL